MKLYNYFQMNECVVDISVITFKKLQILDEEYQGPLLHPLHCSPDQLAGFLTKDRYGEQMTHSIWFFKKVTIYRISGKSFVFLFCGEISVWRVYARYNLSKVDQIQT